MGLSAKRPQSRDCEEELRWLVGQTHAQLKERRSEEGASARRPRSLEGAVELGGLVGQTPVQLRGPGGAKWASRPNTRAASRSRRSEER